MESQLKKKANADITPAEQAAVNYVADKLSGESAIQCAISLECAEFHFRHIPECDRQQAIIQAAANAVAESLKQSEKIE